MITPTNLASTRKQDYVINAESGNIISVANDWFDQNYPDHGRVKVNFLFSEGGKDVYEAYFDAGSSEYLYLIVD